MIEPTKSELDQIEVEMETVKFTDTLLYLENGRVIVSRIILEDGNDDGYMVMWKPAELVTTHVGSLILTQFMPETDDDYIMMPMSRIMTMATPKTDVLEAYHSIIGVSEDGFIPENETIH